MFLVEVLSYTQTTDTELISQEIISSIMSEMVSLIRDPDKDVRTVAAEKLGQLLLLTINN